MHELLRITMAGVPAALQMAHRYRLLNDSSAAESICLDVLAVDPSNEDALVTRVLAITDQFPGASATTLDRALAAAELLTDPYASEYYSGIICERWAKALLQRQLPDVGSVAYDWLARALVCYGKAMALRSEGNDEAILRWNSCVRLIDSEASVKPHDDAEYEPSFE